MNVFNEQPGEVRITMDTLAQSDLDALSKGDVHKLILRAVRLPKQLHVRNFPNLEFLLAYSERAYSIRLTNIPLLNKMFLQNCSQVQVDTEMGIQTIEYLNIPKDDTLTCVIPACSTLRLQKTICKSLTLQAPDRVRNLDMSRVKGLNVSEFLTHFSQLESLYVAWTKLNDVQVIAGLSHLRKLTLLDVGTIESLNFLNGLPELEYLNIGGTTKILDGCIHAHIRACTKLTFVLFTNRNHYDAKLTHYNGCLSSLTSM